MDEPTSGGAGRPGLSARRLREILLEAALIVFAVLVALAAEEWWEDRELAARGRIAVQAVVAELESNRRQIEANRTDNDRAWAEINRALDEGRPVDPGNLSLNPTTSDVWDTVRQSGVTPAVPVDVMARLSEAYGIQATYLARQERLFDAFTELRAAQRLAPQAPAHERLAELWAAEGVRRSMECYTLRAYDVVIEEMNTGRIDPRSLGDVLNDLDTTTESCRDP
jgi:hypothetical protein